MSALDDALALVDFGPCKTADRPQDWINVAGPMCKHCEGVEDVNLAAARIIADEYRKLLAESEEMLAPMAGSPSFDIGERKLIEMTAGRPEHSRFSVCFWLPAGWHFDDGPLDTVENRGYSIVAIHDLPPRTFKHNAEAPTPVKGGRPTQHYADCHKL
jgi:hypothetical protein